MSPSRSDASPTDLIDADLVKLGLSLLTVAPTPEAIAVIGPYLRRRMGMAEPLDQELVTMRAALRDSQANLELERARVDILVKRVATSPVLPGPVWVYRSSERVSCTDEACVACGAWSATESTLTLAMANIRELARALDDLNKRYDAALALGRDTCARWDQTNGELIRARLDIDHAATKITAAEKRARIAEQERDALKARLDAAATPVVGLEVAEDEPGVDVAEAFGFSFQGPPLPLSPRVVPRADVPPAPAVAPPLLEVGASATSQEPAAELAPPARRATQEALSALFTPRLATATPPTPMRKVPLSSWVKPAATAAVEPAKETTTPDRPVSLASQIVPPEQVKGGSSRIFCQPMTGNISALACLNNQALAARAPEAEGPGTSAKLALRLQLRSVEKCPDCTIGPVVKSRLAQLGIHAEVRATVQRTPGKQVSKVP